MEIYAKNTSKISLKILASSISLTSTQRDANTGNKMVYELHPVIALTSSNLTCMQGLWWESYSWGGGSCCDVLEGYIRQGRHPRTHQLLRWTWRMYHFECVCMFQHSSLFLLIRGLMHLFSWALLLHANWFWFLFCIIIKDILSFFLFLPCHMKKYFFAAKANNFLNPIGCFELLMKIYQIKLFS